MVSNPNSNEVEWDEKSERLFEDFVIIQEYMFFVML